MKTITVMDRDPRSGLLSVHLREILAAVGQDALDSRWTIKSIEATGSEPRPFTLPRTLMSHC